MKYTIYKAFYPAVLLTFLFILSYGCGHEHGGDNHSHAMDDHGHDSSPIAEENHDDHDDHGKIVHLNQAQYKNASIDTGWFEMKNLSDVVNANGYTKLDPEDEADVNMPISGTVKSVKVIEGNYVKKGQTLATMTSLEYGQMLLEKSKTKEELLHAEAQLVYLQQDYDRQESLAKDNINAEKVFQKIATDLNATNAKINSVKEQLRIMDETMSMISGGNSSLINITAPISGYITDLNIKIGSITQPGIPMFSIVDNSKMHVDLLVYEKDLNKIKVGQTVRFILTNQSNQEIKGEIYNIGKSFANDTKSVAVHADIEENNANLIPGMYINALIDIGVNKVKTLPEDAIVMAEGRHFIFLYEKENTIVNKDGSLPTDIGFARIEVKVGAKQLGYTEVTPLEEIHKGDLIVTQGAYYLQSHLQKSEGGGEHHH